MKNLLNTVFASLMELRLETLYFTFGRYNFLKLRILFFLSSSLRETSVYIVINYDKFYMYSDRRYLFGRIIFPRQGIVVIFGSTSSGDAKNRLFVVWRATEKLFFF